jgi:hypothetical protein
MVAPSLDAEAEVKAFKEKYSIEEYALLSDARATAKAFEVSGYPMIFLVGKDGKVLWKGHHVADTTLTEAIEKALNEK